MRTLLSAILIALLAGCSASRGPVPPGTVPQQTTLSVEDEQYGHQVLSTLTEQFPLDTDDTKINRARDIADRLARASGNDQTPWHIHVLKDDTVKNAAATRGNYLFVWSGMFNTVTDDTELATILAHEMGHVLANHTAPSPQQEAAQILSGIAGMAAGGALSSQGYGGPLANLAQALVENIFQAALVNPQSQLDELEADLIGLFLMSDAAYDPQIALAFWKRVQNDPDFASSPLQFFSSHPSTIERIQHLEKYIDSARARFQGAKSGVPVPSQPIASSSTYVDSSISNLPSSHHTWMVADSSVPIVDKPRLDAKTVGTVSKGQIIQGSLVQRRWLQISEPTNGYIRSSALSPQ